MSRADVALAGQIRRLTASNTALEKKVDELERKHEELATAVSDRTSRSCSCPNHNRRERNDDGNADSHR